MTNNRLSNHQKRWFSSKFLLVVLATLVFSIFVIWYITNASSSSSDDKSALDLAASNSDVASEVRKQNASEVPYPTQLQRENIQSEGAKSSLAIEVRLLDQAGNHLTEGEIGVIALISGDESRRPSFFATLQGGSTGDLPAWKSSVNVKGIGQVALAAKPERIFLWGRSHGKSVALRSFQVPNNSATLNRHDLVLLEGGSLTVQVTDQDHHPIAGALVAASLRNSPPKDHLQSQILMTDEVGRCYFRHLVIGQYTINAQAIGLSPSADLPHDVLSGESREIQVTLSRGGTISGIVLEAITRPAVDISVFLIDPVYGSPFDLPFGLIDYEPASTLTDSNGRFSFPGIQADHSYYVRAERSKDYWVTSEETYAGNTLTLRLPGKNIVHGRVIFAPDVPSPGTLLNFYPLDKGPLLRRKEPIVADARGEFSTKLLPGRYGLVARHHLGEHVFPIEFVVENDTEIGDLLLPKGGHLEISLVSEKNKEPILNAQIEEIVDRQDLDNKLGTLVGNVDSIWASVQREFYNFDRHRMLKVARSRPTEISPGNYLWQGLATGRHRFGIRASGFAPAEIEIDIFEGEAATIHLELQNGAQLDLQLTQSDGSPASNLSIELLA